MVLGIGTGSTVTQLIEALKDRKIQLSGAVSSSRQTSELLKAARIPELDLNTAGDLDLYIDGADEATADGGVDCRRAGAALTREKRSSPPPPQNSSLASSTTPSWSRYWGSSLCRSRSSPWPGPMSRGSS